MADTVGFGTVGMVQADSAGPGMGRVKILTDYEYIDMSNIVQVMAPVLPMHQQNKAQETFLWRYYKGRQPILDRVKESRPEICNKIVENRAQECVQFKVGYQFAEPLQYVPRSAEDDDPSGHMEAEDAFVDQVRVLNSLCYAAGKDACDRNVFEWACVTGLGYRMLRAVPESERSDGDAPFAMYATDPRCTFVIYSASFDQRPLAGVWVGSDANGDDILNVYTDSEVLVKKAGLPWVSSPNPLGICIFEYELNNARQGVFEPALPILDAINNLESNRVDGIEQTVQSLMVFDNVNIDGELYDEMRERGALKIRSYDGATGKVYTVGEVLDQSQTQTAKDDLYRSFTAIVGIPAANKVVASSSDTGTAVMLRDGWTLAESHAKSYELKWREAERPMLAMLLDICRVQSEERVDLRVRDIDMAFTRRNYENTLVKAQVLTTMLHEDKIDPELAFAACNLFTDPTAAYLQSKAHYDAVKEQGLREAEAIANGQAAEEAARDYNDAMAEASEANMIAQQTGVHP